MMKNKQAVPMSRKIYLELEPPTEEDNVSLQERILRALPKDEPAVLSCAVFPQLDRLMRESDLSLTATLSWNGFAWEVTYLEKGDTTATCCGLCVDLGSTTVAVRLVDLRTTDQPDSSKTCPPDDKSYSDETCPPDDKSDSDKTSPTDDNPDSSEARAQIGQPAHSAPCQVSTYNRQIAFGEDILTRIFRCKDNPEECRKIRELTVETIRECLDQLQQKTGIAPESIGAMVISGNTTMVHFLLGLDAFCIFASPYAPQVSAPGYIRAADLDLPIAGYVYIYPSKANYLGGDIISGMIATGIPEKEEISVFLDIGTNGELVVGSRQFLLAGAGAAGPALEGGVVATGMRAADGAVEHVILKDGAFTLDVIGGGTPRGICGSGIVDLLAQLLLSGWLDIRARFVPEASDRIVLCEKPDQGTAEYAVEYAPGLYFYQSDVDEFVRTKAAANTMVEYMLKSIGMEMSDIGEFHVAGAFGSYIDKESAVTIGLYPDMDRSKIKNAGNSSLEGAERMLRDKTLEREVQRILSDMEYIQFGSVEDFLQIMNAAMALPHTDIDRYPTVKKLLFP